MTDFMASLPSNSNSFAIRDGEGRLTLDIPESDVPTVAAVAIRLRGQAFKVTIEPLEEEPDEWTD